MYSMVGIDVVCVYEDYLSRWAPAWMDAMDAMDSMHEWESATRDRTNDRAFVKSPSVGPSVVRSNASVSISDIESNRGDRSINRFIPAHSFNHSNP